MRVVFRVDASLLIGSGHVMRCLTLASALRQYGHECLFVSRNHDGNLGAQIESKGFKLSLIETESEPGLQESSDSNDYSGWLGVTKNLDADDTTRILSAEDVDWLVLDHYALDSEWVRRVASKIQPGKVLVIDDLADRPHWCHLLLDQNLGRSAGDYAALVPEGCTLLVGTRYALLRDEFREWREESLQRRAGASVRRILLSLGGVDKDNITGSVIRLLADNGVLGHEVELDVVLGSAAPHLEEVKAQLKTVPFKAELHVNVSNMAEHMARADLAIGAAGGTAWERCALGLPTIIIVLADNQLTGARGLEDAGAAYVIDDIGVIPDQLPAMIKKLLDPETISRMSASASAICDGKGVSRVVEAMEKMLGARDD